MSILKIKDSQGNWVGVPTVKGDTGNGISSTTLNDDYTLTLSFTDGTTYTTPSIRGEKGEQGEPATGMEIHICSLSEYDAETRIPTIANPNDKTFYLVPTEDGTSPDLFTEWVYVNNAWEMFGSASVDLSGYLTDVKINGNSVVTDGVANIPKANSSTYGVVKVNGDYGIGKMGDGSLTLILASERESKDGTNMHNIIAPINQHISTFYGLAKASGDTTQSQSDNPVGTYTDEAKASIKNMLGVEDVDIDSKAPVITETISGDIASFDDGADDMPLQSLVVDINPVQDLHGYDHPWVGGGGKNKFPGASDIGGSSSRYGLTWIPQEDGGMKISGTVDTATWLYSDRYIDFEKFYGFSIGDTIAVSGKDTAGDYMTAIHFYNGSTLLVSLANGNSAVIPEGTTRVRLLFYAKGSAPGVVGETINNTVYMQIESGSTATDWTPYENICPISGWEGMEIQHTGKNLFDGVIESGDYNVTPSVGGVKRAAADRMRCANFIPVKPNTTYYSKMPYSNSVVVFYDEKKWMRSNGGYAVARNTTFTTPSWCKYITFYFNGTEYNNDISINYPATDHDYHSYTGHSITIDLGQTVYGGYVDVINGELVVDRASEEFLFVNPDTNNGLDSKIFTLANTSTSTTSKDGKITNVVNEYVYAGASYEKPHFYLGRAGFVIYLKENTYRGGTVQVCYPLAEPIHYPITSHEVKSLLGQNNLWANTGDTGVEYRADTELYIDKQIPDVPVDDVQINGTSILQDGVANVPIFSANNYGVVMVDTVYGITKSTNGKLQTYAAPQGQIKDGATYYRPIVPVNQHQATFYGLAKAAGHDEKNSTLPVGEYTDSAKTAIKNMLGVIDGGGTISETITGTDPTITAQNNFRYMCGELYTLNFTPCVSGVCEVIFTSGATPTVLTLPDTVRMPAWWIGVEANTTYEISIVDGVYGAVMSWS